MATFSKQFLSGSTNGKLISVGATTTTIHATGTSNSIIDEIWLYAVNQSSADVKLTVEWGGTTAADIIEFTVKSESGLYLIVPGLIARGTGTVATTISALCASANAINIGGYVNRIA